MRHLPRKDFYFKTSINEKAVICVTLNYFTKVTKKVFASPILVPVTLVCFVTILVTRNSRTSPFCYNFTCWILVGIGISLVLFLGFDCFVLRKSQKKGTWQHSSILFHVDGIQF
jgi:hypothetical protein